MTIATLVYKDDNHEIKAIHCTKPCEGKTIARRSVKVLNEKLVKEQPLLCGYHCGLEFINIK